MPSTRPKLRTPFPLPCDRTLDDALVEVLEDHAVRGSKGPRELAALLRDLRRDLLRVMATLDTDHLNGAGWLRVSFLLRPAAARARAAHAIAEKELARACAASAKAARRRKPRPRSRPLAPTRRGAA